MTNLKAIADEFVPGAKRKFIPTRLPNDEYRVREHLIQEEAHRLVAAAGNVGFNRERDQLLILMLYRHGFRASEITELQWHQIDFTLNQLIIRRKKGGKPSTHFLDTDELGLLQRLPKAGKFVFGSKDGTTLSRKTIYHIVKRAGELAKIPFQVHPHMLRHTTGYLLANAGQDTRSIQVFLGHKSITTTMRYTEMAPDRFRAFGSILK